VVLLVYVGIYFDELMKKTFCKILQVFQDLHRVSIWINQYHCFPDRIIKLKPKNNCHSDTTSYIGQLLLSYSDQGRAPNKLDAVESSFHCIEAPLKRPEW